LALQRADDHKGSGTSDSQGRAKRRNCRKESRARAGLLLRSSSFYIRCCALLITKVVALLAPLAEFNQPPLSANPSHKLETVRLAFIYIYVRLTTAAVAHSVRTVACVVGEIVAALLFTSTSVSRRAEHV
jgi:hypothetical protein